MKSLDDIINECSIDYEKYTLGCPSDCYGCSCHINPPCSHCVESHTMTLAEFLETQDLSVEEKSEIIKKYT